VKLTVVGCSPAWPNPEGAQSGYLVESAAGGSVLLDCGPGVLARLRGKSLWPDPDAIVITHFHLDHWGDLVPWVWGALYLARHEHRLRTPALWVQPGGRARLEQFGGLLGFTEMFDHVFDVHEYTPGTPFGAGGCTITATVVPHYDLVTHALRVGGDDRIITYSGDSAPSTALVAAATDADLFVCEATLRSAEFDHEPRGHLSLEEAKAAFAAAGARRLLITHRPAELDTPDDVEAAYDGLTCTI
jgi:ribonuclease BN (tRNA processing enzyme)